MNTRDSTANALPPPAAAPGNAPSGAQELFFLTPTKRLLWQALGQEYIEPDQLELEENNSNSQACRQRILENGFIEQSKRRVQNYFGENNVIFSRPG